MLNISKKKDPSIYQVASDNASHQIYLYFLKICPPYYYERLIKITPKFTYKLHTISLWKFNETNSKFTYKVSYAIAKDKLK